MIPNKNKILFIFALCGFLTPFIGSAINLALPVIGDEFSINIISLGWVVTIFFLSNAVFLVPFGRLADILGRRKIFLIGILIFTLTSILCSLANSSLLLLTARALQGLGSAMIFGTSTAILVSIFQPRERGKALGLYATGVYVGFSVGPVLGGFITQYFGWRYIFVTAALLSTVALVMSYMYIKDEWAHAKGENFDIKGSILYAVSIVAMLYGTSMLPCISGYIVVISGILTLVVFCFFENSIKHPVFDIDLLLKNRKFAMANLAALFNFSAAAAVPFVLGIYLQYAKGLQPNKAGFVMLISAIAMILGSPIAGRLSDTKDQRIIASLGLAFSAIALLVMSFVLDINTSLYLLAFLLFLFGFGLSIFATPNTHAAMESVTTRHLGIASSLLGTVRVFGQTMSMGITMLIFSLTIGKVKISKEVLPQLIQSSRIIFLILGLLCICGVFASLARGKKREEKI